MVAEVVGEINMITEGYYWMIGIGLIIILGLCVVICGG
jgi:hypothetical protein